MTRDHAPTEGFLSGFMARYRSGLQGGLSSLEDGMEDSNGYWRFDMGGTEELENYFIFNDRHRGMRMDIDGMSYEELLALGERIGTVSTGLSDDALSKCLNRCIYMHTASGSQEDCDRKCSICQEEYSVGEEVGKMPCKHYYHIPCIQHWLRQKNWCPICKTVALNAK
uniref:RING-type E3 ubiquitin transferase n=1 Tax=Arundo donax TaxID=35708 RepID=A0A0A9E4K6_ARUDO